MTNRSQSRGRSGSFGGFSCQSISINGRENSRQLLRLIGECRALLCDRAGLVDQQELEPEAAFLGFLPAELDTVEKIPVSDVFISLDVIRADGPG